MKKMLSLMFIILLGFSVFAEEVLQVEDEIKVEKNQVVEEKSQNKPDFLLGGGFSFFGPEVDFALKLNHFEAEAEVAFDLFRVGKSFGVYDYMVITPKFNAGYVFNPLEKSKIQFSLGGNIGTCIFFEDDPIFAIGGYGKMCRLFGEHCELGLESYFPFYISGADEYKASFPVNVMANFFMGLIFSEIYCRYRF